MSNIQNLRTHQHQILILGNHPGIIQSMLDYDFLLGKQKPSIIAILAGGRKNQRFFWGDQQILIPLYDSIQTLPIQIRESTSLLLSLVSGRRTNSTLKQLLPVLANLQFATIFAEDVPEQHALDLLTYGQKHQIPILGPASVGLLIPGSFKLGAISGITAEQLIRHHTLTPGSVACFSASGGMIGEILNVLAQHQKHVSFALTFGGDRFPILSPSDAFLLAEQDQQTKTIVYYGELGGSDEYDVIQLIKEKKITKPIIAYISGSVSEMFEHPPQFGHAKALAKHDHETAQAKREALTNAGVKVASSFTEFVSLIKEIPTPKNSSIPDVTDKLTQINRRHSPIFINRISGEKQGSVHVLGQSFQDFINSGSLTHLIGSLWLGRPLRSQLFSQYLDLAFKLCLDHSPQVSGALNTMTAARAGKDLVSSLASGLLTIGPRFGGATNQAAANWFTGVSSSQKPSDFVESFAARREYISGIGHRKYRIDEPDPRVTMITEFLAELSQTPYTDFARQIESITTAKKANLILNVDGALAAVGLDLLQSEEQLSQDELRELIDIEFFNAIFTFARSAGFIAHYLDQRRLDEGLLRLDSNQVQYLP